MFAIIIGIILIILIFLWYMWFLQKKNASTLNKLKDQTEQLKKAKLDDKIEKLEKMKLAGASSDRFNQLKDDYKKQTDQNFSDILTQMRTAEYRNTEFKVFGSSSLLKKTNTEVADFEKKLSEISKGFDDLLVSNERNATHSEELQKNYQSLRKQVLTQSFNYGSATDKLEDELSEIANLLDKEKQLTNKGDHIEASQYLDDIKLKLGLITDQLKVIEPLFHDLNEVFPGQIDEIKRVYQKLVKQYFQFQDDIVQLISETQDEIDESNTKLGELNFDAVNTKNEDIKQRIDDLYETLTVEIDGKKDVLKEQKPVLDYLNHAVFQHNRLDTRIQKLQEGYILTDKTVKTFNDNFTMLNEVRQEYDADVQRIADKKAVFSAVRNDFKEIVKHLDDIEASEKTINDDLNQMLSSEQIARNSVDDYAKRLEIQKKMVEQLRLNGLPDDYLDYFYMVYDEINKLYDELDAKQINMEDISKQVIVTQEDLSNLVEKTKKLKYNVVLTEKLLQYANRYANKNPEFTDQLVRARSLFDNDYNYDEATEVISKALESVESGSVARIKETITA
ncbi:septation ring formation regulator EzrA [Companilactobacillus alimentarius]|uniref:Selenide, water dikinase n=1 Tax=Companilactobacillus alimentarius DSM 20249 TaxID=1423720 RepID=A0A2K9HEH3_9LACO|nr:septation ring formation regulator EzrA [Companilactobacillus alimentarius]AUI70961.1 selenide, water dikinase [Companilactobacillus alimentarius DSM 20249]KRK75076.1 septation ring formation regulator EzrA [Companilactobacillus alimentarius DSM 20249]GEO44151.1 septation ring formation regulator EzrA [Companilactobacillus alimentarius]